MQRNLTWGPRDLRLELSVEEHGSHLNGVVQRVLCRASATVYWVDLDAYARRTALGGLTADETASAAAMVRVDDIVRVLASRHAVRFLLSRALACEPKEVSIERDEFGKPYVTGQRGVHFNVSRSGAECVIGISFSTPVGVDIEQLRRVDGATDLLAELCGPQEVGCWTCEGRPDQRFLNAWTRKEACAKALGTGLRVSPQLFAAGCETGLRKFDVELAGCISALSVETFASPGRAVISVASAYAHTLVTAPHFCQ